MELLYIILGAATVFSLLLFGLESETNILPDYISLSGPIVLIHSKVGFGLVEKIASHKRALRSTGSFAVLVCFLGMALASLGLGTSALSVLFRPEQTQVTQPTNYLAIPGVNDFMPMSVAVEILLALLIGVVIHEGAHAVLCRVEGIELDSTGLVFLSFIPMGAFVEPDEESQDSATRISRMRMASAGILSNLALTIGSVLVVVLLASLLISPVAGGAVGAIYEESPAAQSELTENTVITQVNGEEITSNEDLLQTLNSIDSKTITVTTNAGQTHKISRFVFVSGNRNNLIPTGAKITEINGQQVNTVSDIRKTVTQSQLISVTTSQNKYTIPAGSQVKATIDGKTQVIYITSIGDNRIISTGDLEKTIDSMQDITATVTYYTLPQSEQDEFNKHTTKASNIKIEKTYAGISGISFADTGIVTYPAEEFLSVVSFSALEDASFLQIIVLWFVLPLGKIIPSLEFSFPGFTPVNEVFYQVPFGSGVETVVFFTTTLFFWVAWINFNLALFNCLPIWALDGNHVLRDAVHEIENRLETENGWPVFRAIEYGVPLLALLFFVVILAAPLIVSVL